MVLALHVEIAIDQDLPKTQRLMSEVSLRSGIQYLSEAQKTWHSLRWTSRLFEWVFAKTGLEINDEHEYTSRNTRSKSPASQIMSRTDIGNFFTIPDDFLLDSAFLDWNAEFQ